MEAGALQTAEDTAGEGEVVGAAKVSSITMVWVEEEGEMDTYQWTR